MVVRGKNEWLLEVTKPSLSDPFFYRIGLKWDFYKIGLKRGFFLDLDIPGFDNEGNILSLCIT